MRKREYYEALHVTLPASVVLNLNQSGLFSHSCQHLEGSVWGYLSTRPRTCLPGSLYKASVEENYGFMIVIIDKYTQQGRGAITIGLLSHMHQVTSCADNVTDIVWLGVTSRLKLN